MDIDELLDFYVKSEVQNKIEISGKKNESNQEAMSQEIVNLKGKNMSLKFEVSYRRVVCERLSNNLDRLRKSNNLLMPIYILLCALGTVFAGFMLWVINFISMTWAIVQMSIFIVSILFLLVTNFIDTDKHETFDQICKILTSILFLANLPVIFVQWIVWFVTLYYIDRYISNRVDLTMYNDNTEHNPPQIVISARRNNNIDGDQPVNGNGHQQQNNI